MTSDRTYVAPPAPFAVTCGPTLLFFPTFRDFRVQDSILESSKLIRTNHNVHPDRSETTTVKIIARTRCVKHPTVSEMTSSLPEPSTRVQFTNWAIPAQPHLSRKIFHDQYRTQPRQTVDVTGRFRLLNPECKVVGGAGDGENFLVEAQLSYPAHLLAERIICVTCLNHS